MCPDGSEQNVKRELRDSSAATIERYRAAVITAYGVCQCFEGATTSVIVDTKPVLFVRGRNSVGKHA